MDSVRTVWPHYESIRRATLPSLEDFQKWKLQNSEFVSAREWTPENPGTEVLGFLQDGGWAVLLDSSYVVAADENALAKLSQLFGSSVSFVIQTAGGSSTFMLFKNGELVRAIESVDGNVATRGEAIPEEYGIQIDRYYVAEAETLQRSLGFRFLADAPPTQVTAVAVIDRTDYSAAVQAPEVKDSDPAAPKKPWWRLW